MTTKRIYGKWAGNPQGTKENTALCIVEVMERTGFFHMRQCMRKRGHGTDGLYCKTHAKINETRKEHGLKELGAE